MLCLEQRIYLIQCWTGFRHIITKFNEKFRNTYVSRMGVQKLKLRYFYIELSFDFFKKKVKHFFCIFFYFNVNLMLSLPLC
jgi:hypothetical protein